MEGTVDSLHWGKPTSRKKEGSNFQTMEELCKKGREIGERRQQDGTDLVFYISHTLCLFGRKFPHWHMDTMIVDDKCICEIFGSEISTD